MARGHLLSGACVGVLAAGALGVAEQPVAVRLAVAVIITGGVLLPDIDSRRATVTVALGPLGWALHHLTIGVGRWLYRRTRLPGDDESPGTGHRLISHTYLAAVGTGILVAAGTAWGPAVVAGTSTGWGQPWGQLAGHVAAWWGSGIGGYWWAWGLAAGIGHAVGVAGDTLTVAGAPVWWPLPIEGQRWYHARSPVPFHADGLAEHVLVTPVLYVALSASALWALGWWPPLWQLAETLVRGA